MKSNIANYITALRIVFGVLILTAAYYNNLSMLLLFYLIAVLTDLLDGYVARKYRCSSKFGAKFDIIADNILVFFVGLAIGMIRPDIIYQYSYVLLTLSSYFILVNLISIYKTKKPIFLRTYSANIAAIIFPIVIFSIFFFENTLIIRLYTLIMLFSLSEKLIIQLTKKRVKTLFAYSSHSLNIALMILLLLQVMIVWSIPIKNKFICFGSRCIEVEIKKTPEERMIGLMYRQSLEPNKGMLFG